MFLCPSFPFSSWQCSVRIWVSVSIQTSLFSKESREWGCESVWKRKLVGHRIWLRDLCTLKFGRLGKALSRSQQSPSCFLASQLVLHMSQHLNTLSNIKPILHGTGAGGGSPPPPHFLKKKLRNTQFQIKGIFVGIGIFVWRTLPKHPNIRLVRFDPISSVVSLKTIICTKLHSVVDFCVFTCQVIVYAQTMVSFFIKVLK